MRAQIRSAMAALVAAGLASAALAQSAQHGDMPMPSDTPSTAAFKEADMRMMKGMEVAYTGDPDTDFRLKMIPHHQGAIDMAKVALRFAKDPQTKAMAQTIIDAQEKEIAEMQAWLKAHGK